MRYPALLVLFMLNLLLPAQNLVPNPSFETYTWCSLLIDQAPPWSKPNGSSTDLWHDSCPSFSPTLVMNKNYGYQRPKTGHGMIGFRSWYNGKFSTTPEFREYREMFSIKLLSPMVAGQVYSVRFAINAGEATTHFSDDFSVYFSNTFVYGDNSFMITLKPSAVQPKGIYITETEKWDSITMDYTAKGGEEYMIIGSFRSNDEVEPTLLKNKNLPPDFPNLFGKSTYYFVDDVVVEACDLPSPELRYTHDTLITLPGYRYTWYTNGKPLADTGYFITTRKPAEYMVRVTNERGCTRTAHLDITSDLPDHICSDIRLYPNPGVDYIKFKTVYPDLVKVSVFNAVGQQILKEEPFSGAYNYTIETHGSLAPGLYIVMIEGNNCRLKEKFIIRGD